MSTAELARIAAPVEDAGLGALRTRLGNLPLDELTVTARITGLAADTELTQGFHNPFDEPLEATYIFPLPDRAAVTGMRMEADGRVVEAELAERGAARARYQQAIDAGQRASIAEEERPDVFTMRVGNILPGERVTVRLSLAGRLPYEDGAATYRFPLVVAPRYVPGEPLPGQPVGAGWAWDTDAVPDASRISPPVLLPGFPNPVRLSVEVTVDPAGLPLSGVRSSLHAVTEVDGVIRVRPGERADRDVVLRLGYGGAAGLSGALALATDVAGDGAAGAEGTFWLTVLPLEAAGAARPRDVVLVLDRSGSMGGWKMAAARRAVARIVDTLGSADRFAVLAFDDVVERPPSLPGGLVEGTDRHRFRAVEFLASVPARGGTELWPALVEAVRLLADADADADADGERDRVLVLVTDGQVGNEDQILRELSGPLHTLRVHTVGIDRAVNAGFLTRLAGLGGGRCELVESEDRLDEAMDAIHRRIGAPVLTDLTLAAEGLELVPDTVVPARLPAVFPGAPAVLAGRWRGATGGAAGAPAGGAAITVAGRSPAGAPWSRRLVAGDADAPALTAVWARGHLRDLEDRYSSAMTTAELAGLERRIVETSLRFGVLCRFTAYVAVDTRVVASGGPPRRMVQPVEPTDGWELLGTDATAGLARPMAAPVAGARLALGPAGPAGSAVPMASVPAGFAALGDRLGHADDVAPGRQWALRRPTVPGPTVPGPTVPGPTVAGLRRWLAGEVRRLRALATATAAERLDALRELGTRLAALVQQPGLHAPPADLAMLATLAEELRAAQEPGLDALWGRALAALDGVVAPPARARFWKRA